MAARDATSATIERELSLIKSRLIKNDDIDFAYRVHILAAILKAEKAFHWAKLEIPVETYEDSIGFDTHDVIEAVTGLPGYGCEDE